MLVAAALPLGARSLVVASYDGVLAPHGFYDAAGRSMQSNLRARPVHLRRITSRFGERFDGNGGREVHHGIDYGVPVGTPVLAVGNGRVSKMSSSRSSGNFIELTHAGGYASLYLHLLGFGEQLHVGRVVAQGDVIAFSGNTGHSTGPHLHYELHLDGTALDPLATLAPPSTTLGPMARREHLAFLNQLEAMHDRRTDGQDRDP
jgi:murein DD-endopeptidase MepM/ murein hydrolase activator NlpD